MGCHSLLQGIFPEIESTSPAWQTDSLPLSHLGSPLTVFTSWLIFDTDSFLVSKWCLSDLWSWTLLDDFYIFHHPHLLKNCWGEWRQIWAQILLPAIGFVTLGKLWHFPHKYNYSILLMGSRGFLCGSEVKECKSCRFDLKVGKEMATHSSILAWRISWTEEPGGLQSMVSQRVGHDWSDSECLCLRDHWED